VRERGISFTTRVTFPEALKFHQNSSAAGSCPGATRRLPDTNPRNEPVFRFPNAAFFAKHAAPTVLAFTWYFRFLLRSLRAGPEYFFGAALWVEIWVWQFQ